MAEPPDDLPATLRHQMDDWDERVRDQQLSFAEAAEGLEAEAASVRERLADAPAAQRDPLRRQLEMFDRLAANARQMARIPFPIPEEGVTVREDPDAPDGLAYVDPDEARKMFPHLDEPSAE